MLDVKANFKNRYTGSSTNCAMGCDEPDSQEHLISCKKLENNCVVLEQEQPRYQHLFSEDIEKQLKISTILQGRFKKRKEIIQKMDRGEPHSVFSST